MVSSNSREYTVSLPNTLCSVTYSSAPAETPVKLAPLTAGKVAGNAASGIVPNLSSGIIPDVKFCAFNWVRSTGKLVKLAPSPVKDVAVNPALQVTSLF